MVGTPRLVGRTLGAGLDAAEGVPGVVVVRRHPNVRQVAEGGKVAVALNGPAVGAVGGVGAHLAPQGLVPARVDVLRVVAVGEDRIDGAEVGRPV